MPAVPPSFRAARRAALGVSICLLLLAAPMNDARAQNDDACEDRYAEAETAYLEARFEAAIRPLEDCLRAERLSVGDEVRVHRLLAFAYLGRDGSASNDARRVAEDLLAIDPTYTADPTRDRPDFVALVDEVRAGAPVSADRDLRPTAREEGGGIGGWVLAAVGAAAVVVALVLLGGDEGFGD